MGRAFLVGLVAILVAIIALAWRAPAAWLGGRIADASGGAVHLVASEGTAWNGRGVIAGADGRWRIPIAWRIAAAPLLEGTLAITLEPPAGTARPAGTVRLRSGELTIDNLALAFPAVTFEGLLTSRVPVTLGGDLAVEASHATLARDAGSGAFTVRWDRAHLGFGGETLSLGTLTTTLSARGGGFSGPIVNAGGDVRVAGTLEFSQRGGAVDITLTPLPGAPPSLSRALAGLGTPAGDGGVRLTWRGALQ